MAAEVLTTLNMPKNAKKHHWSTMTFDEKIDLFEEELKEFQVELEAIRNGDKDALARGRLEGYDLIASITFLAEWMTESNSIEENQDA